MGKCCDYSAGKLRTAVLFETATRTSDGAGGSTRAWATVSGAPTRCAAKQLSGRERYASERTEATSTIRIVVRYTNTLKERDRATVDGKRYNIERIDNVEFANRWLEITASGGVAI
jgi:SPP1 family predicted phage head-tail adaptor